MDQKVYRALGAKFTFTLANTSGGTLVVALLAAFFNTLLIVEGTPNTFKLTNAAAITAAGYTCDHVLDDGTIVSGLVATAANSKRSIRQFRAYVIANGLYLTDMDVQANNTAAFNQTIEVVEYSPVEGSAPREFSLSEFKGVFQSATDKVSITNLNLMLKYDTLMLMPIANGHVVTITFKFGTPAA